MNLNSLKSILFLGLFYSLPAVSQDTVIFKVAVYTKHVDKIFPESWYSDEVNATTVPLKEEEKTRSFNVLVTALSKYPTEVLDDYLDNVYVFKRLEFFGVGYGGTNYGRSVYLTNNGIENNYTDLYIEKVFHAEFSSLFFSNFFDDEYESKWKAINDPEFEYGGSGVDALKSGKDSEKFTDELHNLGFLTEYAMSSLENDFNSIAKNIFIGDKEFWEIVSNYPRIKEKVDLFIQLYGEIHADFTYEYFREL